MAAHDSTAAKLYSVQLSPTMLGEVERLPELRGLIECAWDKRVPSRCRAGTYVIEIPIEIIRKLHQFSERMRGDRQCASRSAAISWGHLRSALRWVIEAEQRDTMRSAAAQATHQIEASGTPSISDIELMRRRASAIFLEGDRVLYFGESSECGLEAVVVRGYSMMSVVREGGEFARPDGSRFDYQMGYGIRCIRDNDQFFAPAHSLTRDDCKPSHLRLVASWPKRVEKTA